MAWGVLVMFDVTFAGPSRFFDDELKETYTTPPVSALQQASNREDFGMKWNVPMRTEDSW